MNETVKYVFLAVYVGGIILGNSKLMYKRILSGLFGSLSMLTQILLFIVLGILWIPSSFLPVLPVGLLFALFLFFIARPAVLFLIMKPFRYAAKEIAFVSWSGFRGASSIVFSTYLLSAGLPYAERVFSVVFFVCLLSVIFQGALLAPLAQKLGLVDSEKKASKPVEEYLFEASHELFETEIPFGSLLCGKSVAELDLPENLRVIMMKRNDKYIAPAAESVIAENDILVFACDDEEALAKLSQFAVASTCSTNDYPGT